MNISLNGLGETVVTFEAEQEGAYAVKPGMAVMLAAGGKVVPCEEDAVPVGVVQTVRGGYASVQTRGYVETKGSGLQTGFTRIAADADGLLAENADGREAFVVTIDSISGTYGLLL